MQQVHAHAMLPRAAYVDAYGQSSDCVLLESALDRSCMCVAVCECESARKRPINNIYIIYMTEVDYFRMTCISYNSL